MTHIENFALIGKNGYVPLTCDVHMQHNFQYSPHESTPILSKKNAVNAHARFKKQLLINHDTSANTSYISIYEPMNLYFARD